MELKTVVIISGFIIFFSAAIYFIFFKLNSGSDIPPPKDVCKCPQGCDSDGNCLQAPCPDGRIRNDKGECICPSGIIGPNCGCDTNNYPTGIVDPCRGFGWTCETTGNTDAWVQSTAKDCDTLYKMNCDSKTGDCSKNSYTSKCFSDICNKTDYPDIDTRNYTLDCSSNSGVARPYCEPGCTYQPDPNTDCTTCPTQPDKIFDNNAGVCTCSPETGSKWKCDNTQYKNSCATIAPTGLCGPSGETPQCISCGPESSTWHCGGSSLHTDCATKIYNLEKPDNYSFYQIPKNSDHNKSSTPYPVFPTFDNDRCMSGGVPYDTLTGDSYSSAYNLFDSEQGFVTYNTDGTVKSFLASKNAQDYCVYNVKPTSRDAEGHGIIDFTGKIPTVFPTKDTLVFKNEMGCAKHMSNFCGGHGSLKQDCWSIDGNLLTSCVDPASWYRGDTGKCICDLGYNGVDCQYSNADTCNGHGTVDFNGICTCNYGWGGPTCNFPYICIPTGQGCNPSREDNDPKNPVCCSGNHRCAREGDSGAPGICV